MVDGPMSSPDPVPVRRKLITATYTGQPGLPHLSGYRSGVAFPVGTDPIIAFATLLEYTLTTLPSWVVMLLVTVTPTLMPTVAGPSSYG